VLGLFGCIVVGRADALLAGVVDAPERATEGSLPGWAAPVQDALSNSHPATASVATHFTTDVRPPGRDASHSTIRFDGPRPVRLRVARPNPATLGCGKLERSVTERHPCCAV
jgi:hypothetical protein